MCRRSTEAEIKQLDWDELEPKKIEKVAKYRGRWKSLVHDLCSNGNVRI